MKLLEKTHALALMAALIWLVPGGAAAADEWQAPPEASQVKNSVPKTPESIDRGKTLYLEYCMNCHGLDGKGDGPEAAGLEPKPGDFTNTAKMSAQTDGALFWKLTTGKGKMKPVDQLIPNVTDQQKWDLVNYIRTFATADKKSAGSGKSDPRAPRQAQALMASYLAVAAALNAGNLTSATKNAESLGDLAGKGGAAGKGKKSKTGRGKILKDLATGAKQLQDAGSLAAARQAFEGVSKTVNEWLTLSQYSFGKSLTVYKCPRALDGKEAIWIQETGPVQNPYGVQDIGRAAILRKIPAGRRPRQAPASRISGRTSGSVDN